MRTRAITWTVAASAMLLLLPATPASAVTAQPVVKTTRVETSPAAGGGYLAWSSAPRKRPLSPNVFVRKGNSSTHFVANAPGTSGFAGGIDSSKLVYQQVSNGASDLYVYNLKTNKRQPLSAVNTDASEASPTFSLPWLLFLRVTSKARRIILYNTTTGGSRLLSETPRKTSLAAAGQVNGIFATYSVCAARCNVYLYNIARGTTTTVPNPKKYQYAPSVTASGTVYFARSGSGCGARTTLMRFTKGSSPASVLRLPSKVDVNNTYTVVHGGTTEVYFDRTPCPGPASDIYKLVLSS